MQRSVQKIKACAKKESANNQNEHVAKAKEHKIDALEVTEKVDHHKNIEKKGGYEGKIFKMDTKWVRSFPKRSQTTLLVTITRYPQKKSGLQAHITNAHNTLKKTSEKYHKTTK